MADWKPLAIPRDDIENLKIHCKQFLPCIHFAKTVDLLMTVDGGGADGAERHDCTGMMAADALEAFGLVKPIDDWRVL